MESDDRQSTDPIDQDSTSYNKQVQQDASEIDEHDPEADAVDSGFEGEEEAEYREDDSDNHKVGSARRTRVRSSTRMGSRSNAPRRKKSIATDEDGTSATEGSLPDDGSEASDVQWDEESNGAIEDVEVETANANLCIFCGEDEEHDPSDEFEEYMACAVCGDNAHAHCAREAKSLSEIAEKASWRCPACVANGVSNPNTRSTSPAHKIAPQIARDLLPPQKGNIKPNSHSVFNTLILDDDPMDGSRPLRKRKSSGESDKQRPEIRKRQKRQSNNVEDVNGVADAMLQASARRDDVRSGQEDGKPTGQSALKSRPSRTRQRPSQQQMLARVVEMSADTLVVSFSVQPSVLANLDTERKKRKRRERDKARREKKVVTEEEVPMSHYPALQPSHFATPFYAFQDGESDDIKAKPYGGILSEAEADTGRTFPQPQDRKAFEEARQKAEEEWRLKTESAQSMSVPRPAIKISGPPSKIKCISFGRCEIDTWHAAPYPEEYSRNRVLYICEFCLKYMNSDFVAWRHKLKCPAKHPPGDEIYRDGSFSFFEVDGRKNPVYCQNLCLLAKLFLGSKTLYYDVEPFLFYIMTENDEFGCHFVGYFSKEKRPSSLNNVSCILVLPIHQRRGFGHLLIEFSYLLTRVEEKTGSPEKPLSDMGLVSYRSYWRLVLCNLLVAQTNPLSISHMSEQTGMTADDIVSALEGLRAIVRDPVTKTYALRLDYDYFRRYIDNYEKKGYARLNPEALIWVPYVMGRNNTHYEDGPQLHTVAPREEEETEVFAPEEGVQKTIAAAVISGTHDAERISKSTEDISVQPAPTTENIEKVIATAAMTPFPALDINGGGQTAKRVEDRAGSRVSRSDSDQAHTQIPATRFEVFPPLPGTAARRKPGRPFRRGSSRRGTPVRRAAATRDGSAARETPTTARRTRSTLAEAVQDMEADEDENEGNAEQDEAEEANDNVQDDMGVTSKLKGAMNNDVEMLDATT